MAQQQLKNGKLEQEEEKKQVINMETEKITQIKFDENQMFYGNGGWLPSKDIITSWKCELLEKAREDAADPNVKLSPSVQGLADLINSNDIINELTNQMIKDELRENDETIPRAKILSVDCMLYSLNRIISMGPHWHKGHLIGVPIAALFTGVNATLSGQALFRIASWNKEITCILRAWCKVLDTQDSFPVDPEKNGWLTKEAKEKWAPLKDGGMNLWIKEKEEYPYWCSWNSFFARNINRKCRPISGPEDNNIITSCNDGALFRWRTDISYTDTFWLKDMPYSLTDIFGGADCELSKTFAHKFVGGSVFQTFLDPFNFHRWWSCVSGTIVAVNVIPGYYYSKLVVPDYTGATTASCPYLTHVNTRGIVIIDTSETVGIGLVCCIPIGMAEVSSIVFPKTIKPGVTINKGDEIGNFLFGGSSFAIIFENTLKYNKSIIFEQDNGRDFEKNGNVSPDGNPSVPINVGSQIARITDHKSKLPYN